jgi:DNA polymerase III sliding clamp (beta) subunit (PCNA family)
MKREELLDTLDLVRPALSSKNLVPIYTTFCFTDETVFACNDIITIIAPFKSGIVAGVHGETLIGLLSNSKAKNVTMDLSENSLLVKVGSSKINLPVFPEDDFLFNEADVDSDWMVSLNIDKNLLMGFECCLITSSQDLALPALMGVTLLSTGATCHLYSCDGDALSRFAVGKAKGKCSEHLTMPSEFCRAVLKITSKFKIDEGTLEVNKDWAKATLSNGYIIYGRTIYKKDPLDYEAAIKKSVGKSPQFFDAPSNLVDALARAAVIVNKETMETSLSISDGKIYLKTESSLGVVKDSVAFDGDHEDIDVLVNAASIQRALQVCNEISVREGCTIYKNKDVFLQILGNISR